MTFRSLLDCRYSFVVVVFELRPKVGVVHKLPSTATTTSSTITTTFFQHLVYGGDKTTVKYANFEEQLVGPNQHLQLP